MNIGAVVVQRVEESFWVLIQARYPWIGRQKYDLGAEIVTYIADNREIGMSSLAVWITRRQH